MESFVSFGMKELLGKIEPIFGNDTIEGSSAGNGNVAAYHTGWHQGVSPAEVETLVIFSPRSDCRGSGARSH
jgi:hypothetical protein